MTYVNASPATIAAVAADVEGIGSAIRAAGAVAADRTTDVMQMAADEVSRAVAVLFSEQGRQFQAVSAQTAAFHDEFVRVLSGAGTAYASTEAVNAALARAALISNRTAATTSTLTSTVRQAASAAATTTALVMGPSDVPLPSTTFVNAVDSLYIRPHHPGAVPQALYTPENLFPTSGIFNMTFDVSVAEGVAILDNAIKQQIAHSDVVVFGYSQSATIASLEMRQLAALPAGERPSVDQLSFVLVGDPNNPNGGLFSRFDGLRLPSLGITFSGATPHDVYPTTIYSKEYDGYADFPRYPLNIVSTLNALMGIATEHGHYPDFSSGLVESAVQLPTEGDTLTTYYMIPTEHLPLLAPLRAIPVVGAPLASLIEPNARVIVNLGYGDPDYGYSTGPANVPTGFGVFPEVSPIEVLDALAAGTQQGISQASADLAAMVPSLSPWDLWRLDPSGLTGGMSFSPATALNSLVTTAADTIKNVDTPDLLGTTTVQSIADNVIDSLQVANTEIVDAFTIIATNSIAFIEPSADIALAIAVTIPSYNFNLFLDGISEAVNGNPYGLVNAIGYPLAASTALISLALFIEAEATIYRVILPNISALSGLIGVN
ncbi:PE family protein PE3 [Mycobacterium simulans]|uniref:PE family protein PE3 n=1 Tax=Mycobacterium simulans TaxID=627089 RepID=A0A7Z7NC49_9MYCO|nr:PE-PPE domain-containing protein [Mycobacterium simulans]SOJ56676.1 PE family protein PE3 [Mycobacterium simulans]